MPKKTKKEKLLARYHKKLRLLENRQMTTPYVQEENILKKTPKAIEDLTKVSIAPATEVTTHKEKDLNQYFFSDLRKSLLLIVTIIGVEIGLYFAKLIK
jgi:hypothetical protein